MLVLSRQRDETIMIGDDIRVFIVDIRGDKVRLGIEAPRDLPVHRKEVYDAIKREDKQTSPIEKIGELRYQLLAMILRLEPEARAREIGKLKDDLSALGAAVADCPQAVVG